MKRLVIAVLAMVVLAACSTSGRELRQPGPDQTLSLVTTTTTAAPITAPAGASADAGSTLPGDDGGEGIGNDGMTVTAPWGDNEVIDTKYSCKGANVAPAISWQGVPLGATELAVAVVDLDNSNFVHWVIAGLDPASTGIPEGTLPAGAVQANNGAGTVGWTGPCPPDGQHTYLLTLYALNQPSGITNGMDGTTAIDTLDKDQLASVAVSGLFGA